MLPITRVPETIANGMAKFRSIFCREVGFDHVSRYVTGLILSPNKTLQGIYDLQVWEQHTPSRRAMHAGVFEAGWDDDALMQRHRAEIAPEYRGCGRTVVALDWTLVHHERGPKISAVRRAYDYVAHRTTLLQTNVYFSDGLVLDSRAWPPLWPRCAGLALVNTHNQLTRVIGMVYKFYIAKW